MSLSPGQLSLLFASFLCTCGCTRQRVEASAGKLETPPEAAVAAAGQVRATGTIQAVRALTIQVPQISGQNSRLTLVHLVPNGARVQEGEMLAEFDRTQQMDAARDAQARFDDLGHQVRQKEAQNRSDAEKRSADLADARAALAKAQIQLRKGPILSEIDRLKNEAKAAAATAKVDSLIKVDAARSKADAAGLRILQLQMDRQKVALERAQRNSEKLLVKAPIAGMVALENMWRNGSMGNAREGDQLWTGQPLLKIFDPEEMEVLAQVGEPDGAVLRPGMAARVFLDAYPEAVFDARFHSSNPVATSALGSPIKKFSARFRLMQADPRLLPDLSAAIVMERHP